jgi:hypothetical protein
MQDLLQVSSNDEDYVFLLNPRVQTPDGEWEAWDFGNKYPGANRYRTFAMMMEQVLEDGV